MKIYYPNNIELLSLNDKLKINKIRNYEKKEFNKLKLYLFKEYNENFKYKYKTFKEFKNIIENYSRYNYLDRYELNKHELNKIKNIKNYINDNLNKLSNNVEKLLD